MTTKTDIEQLRAEFEAWKNQSGNWVYIEVDSDALEIFKAGYRAALQSQDREDAIDMEIVAEQLRDMASSAYETAMAFGISQDSFERLAQQVFGHARHIEENE